MEKKIKAVIFDLDGTLVNSMGAALEGLKKSVEWGLKKEIADEEVKKHFGGPPEAIINALIPDEDTRRSSLEKWENFHQSCSQKELPVFEGVLELLENLDQQSCKLALCTGRDRAGAKRILDLHGWMPKYFSEDRIVAGDDPHKIKPSPEGVHALLETLSVKAEECLMVGDSFVDTRAGKSAGCWTAAALWALPKEQSPNKVFGDLWRQWASEESCDWRLDHPHSLLRYFESPYSGEE